MANFKSKPGKMVSVGRKVVKFDSEGFYSTSDKDEIEAFGKAIGIKESKTPKPKDSKDE